MNGGEGGGGLVGCVQYRALSARASPSEVYLAGKLQRYFTYGFDFRHSLRFPFGAAFAVLKELSEYHDTYVQMYMIFIIYYK